MKKTISAALLLLSAAMLSGCKASEIEIETKADMPQAGIIETQPTTAYKKAEVEYVVPEGAKGPGDAYIVGDEYEYYPEDRKPKGEEVQEVQVRYFYVNSKGIGEDFDAVEGTECTAENLMQVLIEDGCLAGSTEIISYEQEGDNGILTLSELTGVYENAAPEQLAQAVADTFIDNLFLDTLTVNVDDKTYGPLKFVK